jgi:hypothetical protein
MSAAPVDQGVTDQKGKNPDRAKGLDEKAREVIARQKVLITDEAFKQVFTPYLSSGLPLFITSDSLLNAYHVLHEETVLRIEMTNALRLPLVLRQLWQGLERADEKVTGKPELVAGAKRRAQVVIATALRLMGEEAIPCGPEVAALADKEVEKIKAATAVEKPAWLGPPDDGFLALDYSRFKPRGFYTRGPLLERYFRAVSWLQAIPFRLDKDEEFLAILLLNRGLGSGSIQDVAGDAWFSPADFLECFGQFIGAADDRPGLMAAPWLRDKLDLNLEGPGWKWQRERVAQEHEGRPQPWSMINDQIALPPDNPAEAAEAQFRILPARRTPDAVLFQRTTDLRQFTRPLPTGLEVAAALGSAFAADRLTGRDRERVLEKIRETQPLFVGDNLYLDYLGCLAALVDKPEPDAPAFMSGEAWQTKSCQTVLGGWAQIRHAFVLQAKQTAFYGCDSSMPCGFVEPEPTFFGRLARLIEKTEALLQKQGELADEFTPVAPRLRAAADMLEKKGFATNSDLTLKDLTREEFELIAQAQRFDGVLRTIPYEPRATKDTAGDKDAVAKKGPGRAESIKKAIAHLREVAAILEQGKLPERYSYAVGWKRSTEYLKTLWHRLGTVARRLETLAHKQLRGVEFDEEEKRFILGYGVQLGHLMFYDGNSYYAPKDDAPRVVDVYVNNWEEKVLEVGIGRPRAIYVLYPYKGGEVLCRGAVMPYYEFPSGERLTDEQWKTLLDSKDSPDVPDWAKPIIGPGMIKPAAPAKE